MDKFLIYNGCIVWVMNKFKFIIECLEIEKNSFWKFIGWLLIMLLRNRDVID